MEKTRGKQTILIYIGLAVLTILAFEEVRKCGFVYDDRAYVLENEYVKAGLKRDSIIWAFTHSHVGNWHPLTGITHMLDCQLFSLNSAGHHLTNLFFHTANVLLLFWVLRNMTDAVWPSAFTAAFFAVHPLHVESVAWVSERKDVLSGFFWMLTMIAYARYVERPGIRRYVLIVAAFCLGLLSKPMLVTLPFVLVLLDYWPLGRLQLSQPEKDKAFSKSKPLEGGCQSTSGWRLIREKIPLCVLAAVSSVITFIVQQSAGAMELTEKLPLNFRISNALLSYISYIGKMIYPSHLAVLYPLNRIPPWQTAVCFMMLVAISTFIIVSRRRYLTVGWLWYLGTLVPVIGLVQVGSQAMADRYTYLPSIGIFIMVAWGTAELGAKWRFQRMWLGISAGLVLAILLICTRMQVRHWKDRITLYAHAVAVTKNNHMMHNNYGNAMFGAGRYEEAAAQYREALRIEPEYFEAHINLGKTILAQKKFQQAADYFRYLITLEPDHLEANVFLSKILLMDLHDTKSAIKQCYRILEIKPDHIETFNNIAWVFATTEDESLSNPSEAIKLAEKACALNKGKSAQPLDTLAAAYASAGRFEEAVETAEKAINLAETQGKKDLAEEIRERLGLYKSGQPYREE